MVGSGLASLGELGWLARSGKQGLEMRWLVFLVNDGGLDHFKASERDHFLELSTLGFEIYLHTSTHCDLLIQLIFLNNL